MNQQSSRTLQTFDTTLGAPDVLASAKRFFARRSGIYSAFLEKEGPTFVALRGQGGEELLVGVAAIAGGTRVTGSSYLFDQQIARFLSTLPVLDAPVADPSAGAPEAAPAAGAES